jgi:hypothetical protein
MRDAFGFMSRDPDDPAVLEQGTSRFAFRAVQKAPHNPFGVHRFTFGPCGVLVRFLVVTLRRSIVDDAFPIRRFDRDGRDQVAAAWPYTTNFDLRFLACPDSRA